MSEILTPPVGLFWFRDVSNFGDLLSPVILEFFLGTEVEWRSERSTRKFVSTGSVIEAAKEGDVVWGTGSKFPQSLESSHFEVLAVRGPRTSHCLGLERAKVALGDPALLLPIVFPATQVNLPSKAVGLIPHYVDRDVLVQREGVDLVIDITNQNWKETVQQIVECSVIVSSSLHGIIVAEAYGVPSVWVQPTDRIFGGHHKFLDYYESTSRRGDCLDWNQPLADLILRAEAPPNFSSLQDSLIDSLEGWLKNHR